MFFELNILNFRFLVVFSFLENLVTVKPVEDIGRGEASLACLLYHLVVDDGGQLNLATPCKIEGGVGR